MLLPPPDLGAAYVEEKSGRPSREFYNWIRSLYVFVRDVRDLLSSNNTWTGANTFDGNTVTITPTDSTLERGLVIDQFFQGDVTDPLFRGANLISFGDMSNVTPAGANINALHIQHQYFGGPNCAGSHQGMGVEVHHQGGLGPTPITDTSFPGVQGATITAGSDQSWGGVFPTSKGQVYGMQVFANADNSGFLDHVHGMEIDVGISGGTGSRLKSILDLLLQASNTAQATEIDAAIVIGTSGVLADPTKAFRDGILFFQNAAGGWTPPCSSSNGTFIRCQNTHNLVGGIDFSSATFSGNFLNGAGWSVDGSGNMHLNMASIKNAANDAAAAGLGVAVGGVYRNGSVLMVRVV